MNPALIALLAVVSGGAVVGIILMIKQLNSCQEGYEDENGFHFGRFAESQVRIRATRPKTELTEAQHAA